MSLSITTPTIMTFNTMILSITTLNTKTLSIMTLNIVNLIWMLSINQEDVHFWLKNTYPSQTVHFRIPRQPLIKK